jgi:hypothetical protein
LINTPVLSIHSNKIDLKITNVKWPAEYQLYQNNSTTTIIAEIELKIEIWNFREEVVQLTYPDSCKL